MSLEELQANTSRTHELEKEVKEKTVLVNKLRHEGANRLFAFVKHVMNTVIQRLS
jgi:hypothetical protein